MPDPLHDGGASAASASLNHALDDLNEQEDEFLSYEQAMAACLATTKGADAPKTYADALRRPKEEAEE